MSPKLAPNVPGVAIRLLLGLRHLLATGGLPAASATRSKTGSGSGRCSTASTTSSSVGCRTTPGCVRGTAATPRSAQNAPTWPSGANAAGRPASSTRLRYPTCSPRWHRKAACPHGRSAGHRSGQPVQVSGPVKCRAHCAAQEANAAGCLVSAAVCSPTPVSARAVWGGEDPGPGPAGRKQPAYDCSPGDSVLSGQRDHAVHCQMRRPPLPARPAMICATLISVNSSYFSWRLRCLMRLPETLRCCAPPLPGRPTA